MARCLNIRTVLSSRKYSHVRFGTLGLRNDIGTVDQSTGVVAENSELGHSGFELANHGVVIGCVSVEGDVRLRRCMVMGGRHTDEGLPLASSARVTSEFKVGLKAEFSMKRGLDFALVGAITREKCALQQSLEGIDMSK